MIAPSSLPDVRVRFYRLPTYVFPCFPFSRRAFLSILSLGIYTLVYVSRICHPVASLTQISSREGTYGMGLASIIDFHEFSFWKNISLVLFLFFIGNRRCWWDVRGMKEEKYYEINESVVFQRKFFYTSHFLKIVTTYYENSYFSVFDLKKKNLDRKLYCKKRCVTILRIFHTHLLVLCAFFAVLHF